MTREATQTESDDLGTILRMLTAGIGLDPRSVGQDTVVRMVRLRMEHAGCTNPEDYLRLLRRSPQELVALQEAAAVPETWFFRNEEAFKLLAETAWKRLAARPTIPFRILSIPCSSGEEPYSAAMALLDRGVAAASFRIDAVDLRAGAIAAAQRAVYGPASFRAEDLTFRDRHFRPDDGLYRLTSAAKDEVTFQQGNLLDPLFLAGSAPYDALMCRNLLIYFDDPARKRALQAIERLLSPTGLLLVGHAEALWLPRDRFEPVDRPGAFAARRRDATNRRPHAAIPAPTAVPKALTLPPPEPRRRATSCRLQVVPAPPEVPVDPLLEAQRLADTGRGPEAEKILLELLDEGERTPRAYLLLGLVRQAAGREDLAEESLAKAVYLDPQNAEALALLALLKERRGDTTTARRLRERAARASSGGDA